ncbi:hypothetical protein QBC46DRAFT_393835 [Diplogelasinospora grovesii]|uniref:Uncharacterized protein n=1 Tax=Diplogelasinospora grovesii TaxID=303347 RepID=A0AAN6N1N2_9PEZI|nr:hypothetical protein QBC46DRAFT_393835 [Diplogelasinospora grovesii]
MAKDIGPSNSRRAANHDEEEARAEVDVINAHLKKQAEITKKIQACLGRIEAAGKSLHDATEGLDDDTKKSLIVHKNINALLEAIKKRRQQMADTSKNDDEEATTSEEPEPEPEPKPEPEPEEAGVSLTPEAGLREKLRAAIEKHQRQQAPIPNTASASSVDSVMNRPRPIPRACTDPTSPVHRGTFISKGRNNGEASNRKEQE